MRIETRKVGKIVILDISGKITIGEGTIQLKDTFKELLTQGEKLFIFNMLKVPWLDSAGIGEVVACHKRAVDKEALVKLVLKGRANDLFSLYWLPKIFEIYDSVKEAQASFGE